LNNLGQYRIESRCEFRKTKFEIPSTKFETNPNNQILNERSADNKPYYISMIVDKNPALKGEQASRLLLSSGPKSRSHHIAHLWTPYNSTPSTGETPMLP